MSAVYHARGISEGTPTEIMLGVHRACKGTAAHHREMPQLMCCPVPLVHRQLHSPLQTSSFRYIVCITDPCARHPSRPAVYMSLALQLLKHKSVAAYLVIP